MHIFMNKREHMYEFQKLELIQQHALTAAKSKTRKSKIRLRNKV